MPGSTTQTYDQQTQQNSRSAEFGNTSQNTNQTQQQQQQGQTGPWSETQPLLSNILSTLQGLSMTPSAGQSEAVAGLQANAGAIPNFGAAGAGVVGDFLGSSPQYSGMLTGALNEYRGGLDPYLSSTYLDPMSTPGLSDALSRVRGDITENINTRFAKAGRDLSPQHAEALSRGLTEGMAPIITNQFNQNVAAQRGAQDAGFAAGTAIPGMLSGMDQTALGNRAQGINLAGSIPGLFTQPSASQLEAANTAFGLPLNNLGMLSNILLPISKLGTTTSGTTTGETAGANTGTYGGQSMTIGNSNTTGSKTGSWLDAIGGGVKTAGQVLAFLSDERTKENIAPVGMLFDGEPVFSFNYIGDERPQIGLMAQSVEESTPEAVVEIGGLKHVDYGKATERARQIGMLSDLPIAA